jgi:undecaprenyl-diphosphatase
MFRAAVLGLLQGLTEFVPVSSSAHLVIVPFLFRWPAPTLAFDVALHVGTLLALLLYFARDLAGIATGSFRTLTGRGDQMDRANARLLGLLAIGSVPAAIAGILVESRLESVYNTTESVDRIGAPLTGLELLGTAALLWVAEAVYARRGEEAGREIADLRWLDAIVIGAWQALAIVPGISRSGATIAGGIFRRVRRDSAARFSFLLSIPAIFGAALVSLPDVPAGADLGPMLVGALTAAVSGFAAIAFLLRYLRTRTMRPFAVYCVIAAAITLAYWSQIR